MDAEALGFTQPIATVHDDHLEALRVAAFKAQEAATRCEKQAADCFPIRNSNSLSESTNPLNPSSRPTWTIVMPLSDNNTLKPINSVIGNFHPGHASPPRTLPALSEEEKIENLRADREGEHEKIELVNGKLSQQNALNVSDVVEATGDSGLGESLSDTERSAGRTSTIGISSRSKTDEIAPNHVLAVNAGAQNHIDLLRQPDEGLKLSSPSFAKSDPPVPAQQIVSQVRSPSLVLVFKLPGKLGIFSQAKSGNSQSIANFKPSINNPSNGTFSQRWRGLQKTIGDDQRSRPKFRKPRAAAKQTISRNIHGSVMQAHDEFRQKSKPTRGRPRKLPAVPQSMPVPYQSVYAPNPHSSSKSLISQPGSSQCSASSTIVDSGLNNLDLEYSNLSIVPHEPVSELSSSNNASFLKAFQKSIVPIIQRVARYYNDALPGEKLFPICKEVTDEIASKDFQAFMRKCSYDLNDKQVKKIETSIIASFSRRVSLATVKGESHALDQQFRTVTPSFLPDFAEDLPSQGLNLAPTSTDLSLLGPGMMIKSTVPTTPLFDSRLENPISLDPSKENQAHRLGGWMGSLSITPEDQQTTSSRRIFNDEHNKGRREILDLLNGSTRVPNNFINDDSNPRMVNFSGTDVAASSSQLLLDTSNLPATSLNSNSREGYQCSDASASGMPIQHERKIQDTGVANQSEGSLPSNVKDVHQNGCVSSLPQAFTYSVESTFYSDGEDQLSVEDGEKFLAGWLSADPDKTQPCKNKKSTVLSNGVLSPNISTSPSSSVSSKKDYLSATNVISYEATPDVGSHKTKTKSTPKNNPSFASSASITQSFGDLGPEDRPGKANRKPSCKSLPPQPAADLDLEVLSDNPDDLGPNDFGSQNEPTMRRSRRVSSTRYGFRTKILEGNLSTNYDPYLEKTLSDITLKAPYVRKPYDKQHRNIIKPTDRHGSLKHVDFSDEECEEISKVFVTLFGPIPASQVGMSCREQLHSRVQDLSYDDVSAVITEARSDVNGVLQNRKRKSIRAFLSDLAESVPDRPKLARVEVQIIDPLYQSERSTATLLRNRELGFGFRSKRNVQSELRLRTSENISPWRSWKGASGDIVACAWAPNSSNYAAGAAAPDNDEDLQYNRPRNLLYGDIDANTLEELPDHRINRPKPETITTGPNSTQAVYDACDPMIYKTVSSLQFSREGHQLYTASHDMKVKIWDVSSTEISCIETLDHSSIVIDLDVALQYETLFATASKTIDGAVCVYYPNSDSSGDRQFSSMNFTSTRAKENPKWELYPGCVRWGKTSNTGNLLLAGFMQWGDLARDSCREGQICLWDTYTGKNLKVTPGSQSVYTVAWHPSFDMFATGGGFSRGRPLSHRNTRSVIRTWDIRTSGLARYAVEFECPAHDMQDITFNPLFPYIVTAGCTDSATYVWDFRKPDEVLLRLEHGQPLVDWDHTKTREEGDTGVMMTLWGMEGSRFYTGSSDGIVKCWDTSRAPEDAFIRDVGDLGAGVQSGAFSPDFSYLLVGDADGGVHILTSSPVDGGYDISSDSSSDAARSINLINARETNEVVDNPGIEGILAAKELLESGELLLDKKYGVGKGPRYRGPFAWHARPENADLMISRLLPEFDAMQPFSTNGHERSDIANKIQGMIEERKLHIATKQKAEKDEYDLKTGNRKAKTNTKKPKLSPSSPNPKIKRSRSEDEPFPPSKKPKWDIIDLSSTPPHQSLTSAEPARPRVIDMTAFSRCSRDRPIELDFCSDAEVEDNVIPEWEMLEENHWWPRWDEEVFRRLGVSG